MPHQRPAWQIKAPAKCPSCAQPVAWRKYFWSGPIWRAWVCPGCGALLKWRLLRRITYVAIMLAAIHLYFRSALVTSFGAYSALLILMPPMVILMLALERVRVCGHVGLACLGCGYSLAGLRLDASGDLRCPECAKVAGQKQLASLPVDAQEV